MEGKVLENTAASEFDYTVNGVAITITGYKGNGTDIAIPGQIDGFPVAAIGDHAFGNKQLTSVTIPDSVTVIGDYAFRGNHLTRLTIPDSVESIGYWAFANNQQLASVTIGNSVVTIGAAAFENTRLTSVDIPNSVITIGDAAFRIHTLTNVTIGASVKTIEVFAFQGTQLAGVTIPHSVRTIGNRAFANNQQLTSVTIGPEVKVKDHSFDGNFADVYANADRQAGTYISDDYGKTWSRQ
jgi:hypothetical protein